MQGSRIMWLSLLCLLQVSLGNAKDIPREVDALHDDIWKRFIYTNGLVLDYVPEGGDQGFPTAEECAAGKPNAVSWWTPVENGAFFTGLYLDGICRRWKLTKAEADKAKAQRLAEGLMQCASVGKTPGFVARFVLSDGRSHYGLGSDDQTGPWFYGLWCYLRSGIPDAAEKERITAKMVEVATALKAKQWMLPCNPIGDLRAGQYRGGFGGADYRAVSRLLFVTRALFELTGDEQWRQEYDKVREGKPPGSDKTRLQIVAEAMAGDYALMPMLSKQQLWIFVNAQEMIRDLYELESDPVIRASYLQALQANARTVMPQLAEAANAADWKSAAFNPDWRALNELWTTQTTSEEATKVAQKQFKLWNNKGRNLEIKSLREPVCAAWIIFLVPNEGGTEKNAEEVFQRLLKQTDWKNVSSSFGIFAEAAWYQMASRE